MNKNDCLMDCGYYIGDGGVPGGIRYVPPAGTKLNENGYLEMIDENKTKIFPPDTVVSDVVLDPDIYPPMEQDFEKLNNLNNLIKNKFLDEVNLSGDVFEYLIQESLKLFPESHISQIKENLIKQLKLMTDSFQEYCEQIIDNMLTCD